MKINEVITRGIVSDLPPLPGTSPIKPGHVRLYHQTSRDMIDQVAREGIQLSRARGIEGPRAIWAGEEPFYGSATKIPTIEFQVPEKNWDAPFVIQDEVLPSQFIAVHLPWHARARYILDNPKTLSGVLAGKFDYLMDESDYADAIKYVKLLKD